jgi:hypothetical protein
LTSACLQLQRTLIARTERRQLAGLDRPAGDAAVEVVATERRVATGGEHLEHALRQAQDADVEGAAAEVIDGVHAFAGVVQAVGDGGGGRSSRRSTLEAGQLRGILGGLALRTSSKYAGTVMTAPVSSPAEAGLGALAQLAQDLGDTSTVAASDAGAAAGSARMPGQSTKS